MATDFLASDIIFPCNPSECKLSSVFSKPPASVDWALHDHYRTMIHKALTPIHKTTHICHFESLADQYLCESPEFPANMWEPATDGFKHNALIFVLPQTTLDRSDRRPMTVPPHYNCDSNSKYHLSLCDDLEHDNNNGNDGATSKPTNVDSRELDDTVWKKVIHTSEPITKERASQMTFTAPPHPYLDELDIPISSDKPTPELYGWSYKRLWHSVTNKFKKLKAYGTPRIMKKHARNRHCL